MTRTEFLLTISIQYHADISDENKTKYQLGDYKLIQYQILQTNITKTVWQTVTRITNENLGVKGLRTKRVTCKVQPSVSLMHCDHILMSSVIYYKTDPGKYGISSFYTIKKQKNGMVTSSVSSVHLRILRKNQPKFMHNIQLITYFLCVFSFISVQKHGKDFSASK